MNLFQSDKHGTSLLSQLQYCQISTWAFQSTLQDHCEAVLSLKCCLQHSKKERQRKMKFVIISEWSVTDGVFVDSLSSSFSFLFYILPSNVFSIPNHSMEKLHFHTEYNEHNEEAKLNRRNEGEKRRGRGRKGTHDDNSSSLRVDDTPSSRLVLYK